jgi:TetR/AcrR family transcriptional regulator, mexJK operon transcriptional repressor
MTAIEGNRPGKDERRAAILEIAREAFLRDGYAATSMSQISVRLGGSKATLYNYFSSKKDLFFAVIDSESGKLMDDLYRVDKGWTDVREGLSVFCHRFMTMVLGEEVTAFNRMIIAESVRFPEISLAAYEFGYKRGLDRMEEMMQVGMAAGVLRRANSRTAAEYLLNICSGHLHMLRQWNVIPGVSAEQIESHTKLVSAAFLSLYGNDALAREARQFTGL